MSIHRGRAGLGVAIECVCLTLVSSPIAAAYAGTYVDSLYGEAVVSLEGDQLSMQRGEWNAPLTYWNGKNIRWGTLQSAAVTSLFIRFDTTPDGKVGALMFPVGADTVFMSRKTPAGRAAVTP